VKKKYINELSHLKMERITCCSQQDRGLIKCSQYSGVPAELVSARLIGYAQPWAAAAPGRQKRRLGSW